MNITKSGYINDENPILFSKISYYDFKNMVDGYIVKYRQYLSLNDYTFIYKNDTFKSFYKELKRLNDKGLQIKDIINKIVIDSVESNLKMNKVGYPIDKNCKFGSMATNNILSNRKQTVLDVSIDNDEIVSLYVEVK